MARPVLTVDESKKMDFRVLIDRVESIMAAYEAPGVDMPETAEQRKERITRTLDEMPDIYRWFLTLEAHFDHWADGFGTMYGMKSPDYKSMRERRDLFKNMASAAKKRYDGSSRLVTVIMGDEEHMPRGRG